MTAHVCKFSKICVKSLSEKLISIVQKEKSKPCGEGTISRLISKEWTQNYSEWHPWKLQILIFAVKMFSWSNFGTSGTVHVNVGIFKLYTNKKTSSNSEGMQRIFWTVSAEHYCGIWTSFLGWIWRRLSFLKFLRNFTLIWTVRANLFAYDHYVEWPKINSWVSWGVNTQTSRLWLICSCSILLPSNVVRNVLLLFVVPWGFFFFCDVRTSF